MFGKFLQRVKAIPPRPSEWTNRLGPAALIGMDGRVAGSGSKLINYFVTKDRKDCDHYAEVVLHDGSSPLDLPPETVSLLPTLDCGIMRPDPDGDQAPPTDAEWYLGASDATTSLLEKGYTVVNAGGDGSMTLPMLESYKRVFPEDEVILVHLSAYPTVSNPVSSVRVALEKNLVKGVISMANRCVSAEDRKLRKQFKMFYMDLYGIYGKGLFCIRDIRNDYPVFLSIDLGVLDPCCAPGVEEPSSGGLSVRDALHMINAIRGPKLAGVDIHGYRPELDVVRGDGVGLTQLAGSRLIKESLFKVFGISSVTEQEGIERMKTMQRQGQIAAENPYPEF